MVDTYILRDGKIFCLFSWNNNQTLPLQQEIDPETYDALLYHITLDGETRMVASPIPSPEGEPFYT